MKLKSLLMLAGAGVLAACVTTVAGLSFGNNAGDYPKDGKCDDPRFTGGGMASALHVNNIGKDASDCRRLYNAERIRLARTRDEWDVEQCQAVDFGDNASYRAQNGICDDPRFTGPGVDEFLVPDNLRTDAADCQALCYSGEVWLK